ncbi:MAG: hypothetical protein QXI91_05350 [Candidatus Bathyarchaeia archaeon]
MAAIFIGGNTLNLIFHDTAPEGKRYALCITLQYFGFKPSTATATLTVEPQSTQLLITDKTPEQLEQQARQNGWLEVWGPDSWSIFPPFFKFHAKARLNSFGLENQIWVGLFACGVDNASGLCNLLRKAFENLDDVTRDIVYAAVTSMMTSVYALFWFNAVAASLGTMTIGGYIATLALYTCVTSAFILGLYVYPDVKVSRALLYGVGFALLGMTLVAFWNDPQARIFPSILKQQLTGEDTATIAAKSVLTFFLTAIATSNLLSASIIFSNPLMWPFAISTFALGLLAIYLAQNR